MKNNYIHVNFCALADFWTAKRPVLCHLLCCFNPRFKEKETGEDVELNGHVFLRRVRKKS